MKQSILCYLLLPAIFAGCSNGPLTSPEVPTNTEQEISFCIGLENTRAVIEEKFFPENSQIGIFGILTTNENSVTVGNDPEEEYELKENLNNGLYFACAPKEASETQSLVTLPGYGAKFPTGEEEVIVFYAYYPHNPELTAPHLFNAKLPTVPVIGSETMEATDDYVYAEKLVSPLTFSPIALKFKHAMGRLDIHIRNAGADIKAEAKVTKIAVITRKHQQGEMSLANGNIDFVNQNIEESQKVDSIVYELTEDYHIEDIYGDTGARFLLIPENDAIQKIVLSIQRTDDEITFSETKYIVFDGEDKENGSNREINIQAGKVTTVRLNYTPTEIGATAEIEPWDEYDEIYEFNIE